MKSHLQLGLARVGNVQQLLCLSSLGLLAQKQVTFLNWLSLASALSLNLSKPPRPLFLEIFPAEKLCDQADSLHGTATLFSQFYLLPTYCNWNLHHSPNLLFNTFDSFLKASSTITISFSEEDLDNFFPVRTDKQMIFITAPFTGCSVSETVL